jgi:pilus assembly protein Flp/PilA
MNSFLTRHYLRARDAIVRDEQGATAVEYGLIVGLIAVVIIGAVALLGTGLSDWFDDINTCIGNAASCQ